MFLSYSFFWGKGAPCRSSPERRYLPYLFFLNKYAVLFYSRFILLLSLFYTDHLVSIILFNYDYLNSTTILLCLCFYSLYYNFVNLIFICNNNNSAQISFKSRCFLYLLTTEWQRKESRLESICLFLLYFPFFDFILFSFVTSYELIDVLILLKWCYWFAIKHLFWILIYCY